MKKLLLIASFMPFVSMAAMAEGSTFSVGLYGGPTLSSSTNTATLKAVPGTSNKKSDLGGAGGTVGVMASYDYVMSNKGVWGLDIFGAWHNHTAKQDSKLGALALNTKTKMKYSFGTAFKLGYMFDKAMLFGRIGYINSRFEHFSEYVGAPKSSTKKKNVPGLLLGAGIDLPLGEKMVLGISYDFALYQKQSNTYAPFNTSTTTVTNSFKPRMHFVNVALKYKF